MATKLGPCRIGFHAWSKWADQGDGKLTQRDLNDPKAETVCYGNFTQQLRRCDRCGKLQYRREKVS